MLCSLTASEFLTELKLIKCIPHTPVLQIIKHAHRHCEYKPRVYSDRGKYPVVLVNQN